MGQKYRHPEVLRCKTTNVKGVGRPSSVSRCRRRPALDTFPWSRSLGGAALVTPPAPTRYTSPTNPASLSPHLYSLSPASASLDSCLVVPAWCLLLVCFLDWRVRWSHPPLVRYTGCSSRFLFISLWYGIAVVVGFISKYMGSLGEIGSRFGAGSQRCNLFPDSVMQGSLFSFPPPLWFLRGACCSVD